jgi:phosphatidylglycerophosphate synthase
MGVDRGWTRGGPPHGVPRSPDHGCAGHQRLAHPFPDDSLADTPDAFPAPTVAVLLGLEPQDGGGRSPTSWNALLPILGRSPFQRQLRHLSDVGVRRFVVPLGATGEAAGAVERLCREQARQILRVQADLSFVSPDGALEATGASEGEPVVLTAAASIIDPRIYREAIGAGRAVWMGDAGAGVPGEPATVGLRVMAIASLPAGGPLPANPFRGAADEALLVDDMEAYIPDMRSTLRPFWLTVRNDEDRARAGRLFMRMAQKGTLDLPARYLHPPFENFFARLLAPTPITPNHVTVVTAFTGFYVTYLFATGSYGLGLILALITNVLDGVDGKLARVRLQSSRFGGMLDHTLDVTFEFSWYLGLGWGLGDGDATSTPFLMAVALILVQLGARGVSGIYMSVTGRQIHDHTAFDRAVRLVAGRRNIYVMFLVAGYLVGDVSGAFTLCFAWAVGTLLLYIGRTLFAWVREALHE